MVLKQVLDDHMTSGTGELLISTLLLIKGVFSFWKTAKLLFFYMYAVIIDGFSTFQKSECNPINTKSRTYQVSVAIQYIKKVTATKKL